MKVFTSAKDKIPDFIHIDDHDIWSLDCTLAYIIVPLMERYLEYELGCIPNDEDMRKGHEEKLHIIRESIWAFKEIRNNNPNTPLVSNYSQDNINIWQRDYDAYQARMDTALTNFGKYIRSFWT